MAAKARQERRLRLPHNVAGDADHHVVETAVLKVVFDPGSTRPRDRSVDHIELAIVGAPDFVLAPVDALPVGKEAVTVRRKQVVDNDLGPRRGKSANIARAAR